MKLPENLEAMQLNNSSSPREVQEDESVVDSQVKEVIVEKAEQIVNISVESIKELSIKD